MIEAAGTDQVTAFNEALEAALQGEALTDTGLPEVVVDALIALAMRWPIATDADAESAHSVFATMPNT